MSGQGYEQLTLSAEGSPASHFPWLETKKAKGMTVTFGRKCSELSESLRRVGYSVRTYLESCVSRQTMYAPTWSVRATKSQYLILKLRLSARRIEGNESSLWPTPDTQNHRDGTKMRKAANGHHAVSLHHAAAMWRTPTSRDHKDGSAEACKNVPVNALLGRAVHMWPTPRAQMAHGTGPSRVGNKADLQTTASGQLNPEFVEMLMGFPPGWSALE